MVCLFPDRIRTDRLCLEAADLDSVTLEQLYEAYSGPGLEDVMAYVPLEPYSTPEEARSFLERAGSKRGENDSATYAIYPRDGEDGAHEFAGTTTLFPDWDRGSASLAIVLLEEFWGRGYSGERAAAMFAVAFDVLDLEVVAIGCLPENTQSKRAIEGYVDRFNGTSDGLFRNARCLDGEPVDLHRFTVTREQYDAATPTPEPTLEYT